MKILSIKALNINSLKGTIEINFEELTKDGALFAITGPTGSGKSTLLDIISCALYGQTARLGKSVNNLMSRHSGEAYCEVEFEIKGKKYRSSWSQHRAYKKHNEDFQTAKMELVDLADGKPFPLKSNEVSKKIEELSGLDFGRFTQSMMLAQGGFDAFLKANEKERSALLEKITGTQIYADISKAIFEKHRDFQQDMDSDQKILESIELLDEKTVEEKQKLLDQNIIDKLKTDKELKELNNALNWVQRLSELIMESKRHEQEFLDATKLKEEYKTSFAKLDLANRALNVDSTFTAHSQLQHSVTTDKTTAVNLSKELETLDVQIKSKDEEYSLMKKEFDIASIEYDKENQKLKQARDIQTQEKQTEISVTKVQLSLKSKKDTLIAISSDLNTLIEKYNQLQEQAETKRAYLKNNSKDEKLISTIGIIEQNITQYKEEQKNLTTNQSKLELLSTTLLAEQTNFDITKEKVNKLSLMFTEKELEYKKFQENSSNDIKVEETIHKSLEDTQTLMRTLESYIQFSKKRDDELKENANYIIQENSLVETHKVSQQHINEIKKHIETLRDKRDKEQLLAKYEDDRNKLVKDEACFLCGSTEHPYVEKLVEVHIDTTEIMILSQVKEFEEKETALKDLESRLTSTKTKIETSNLEQKKIDNEIEKLQTIFKQFSFELTDDSEANLKDKFEELTKQLAELKQNRIKKDDALKKKDEANEQLQIEDKSLTELNIAMQKHISEKEQSTLAIKSNQSKIESYIQSLKSHWKESSLELDIQILDTQYQELVKRKGLYTEILETLKSLDIEINRCDIDKKESETKATSITAEIEASKQDLKELEVSIKELSSKRIEILNVADLDTHEKEITAKFKTIQEKEQLSKTQLNELKTKNEERTTNKKNLDLKILEDEKKLNLLTAELEALYIKNDFKNSEDLKNAKLSTQAREELATLCKGIEESYAQTQVLKIETAKKLEEHKQKPLSDKPIEELEILQSLLGQKTDALAQSIGSDKKELELNQENSEKHKARISSLEKKKETFKVWAKLNELVGSADGTKFKKFAQGITLDQLINLANQHLNVLSNRYTLARNQDKLLDLEVIDAFQGNVVRSVSTLSGGESFIVSLALALGLSELASQKIAIDSLFLDEGFGTLDEESLEIALNALNLLQSGGKMVGVISHVEALKERIPLQIKVIKNGDGTSFVEIGN